MILPLNDNGTLQKYTWPGGYPIFYLDRNNSIFCPACAQKFYADPDELPAIKPIAAGTNYENPNLYCEQCSTQIESAYTED